MKDSAIKRYVTQIVIYSLIYGLCLVILDTLFNGFVVDFLYERLPRLLFYRINNNREFYILVVYILGLVILSVLYIFRLNRLLLIASRAIAGDSRALMREDCPEELRDFRQKLTDFQFALKENERARQLSEQQKNDLIVYLAHDLKTPLTSVIGYLSLLCESPDLAPEQRARYVGIALDKAYRLEHLINEFFDITRLNLQMPETQKTQVNLTILLVQVLHEFFPLFEEKQLRVVQNIESEILLYADADALARLFDNLFRNAVNYSYEQTDIVCSARKRDAQAIIILRNTGDDIPPEKLNRIFDKFYRLDTSRATSTGGSGLGLAIARQIVEMHQGTITAACSNGVTEFRVMLPIVKKS